MTNFLSTMQPFASQVPSTPQHLEIEKEHIDSFSPKKPSPIVSFQQTYLAHHGSSFMSKESVHSPPSLTAVSTKFSASSINNAAANSMPQEKKSRRRKLKFGGILKLPGRWRKPPSEAHLRRKLRRLAERGDWDGARKFIAGYEFSPLAPQDQQARVTEGLLPPGEPGTSFKRRSSYKSNRRSFTRTESAAAASAIKAALIEESESSSSTDEANLGENVLHDICRCQPPLDVLKTLLAALRHRRRGATTSSTDDHGRTPLHLAAMTGASPQVVDALVRADPAPASVGDADDRSPLHLAMKHLVDHDHHSASFSCHGRVCKQSTKRQEKIMPSPQEMSERTYQTALILKDAMLTYPGKVDFKDEDATGYSPLDYAIDGNTHEELIHILLRRKEPMSKSARPLGITLANHRHPFVQSSHSDFQDMKVLRCLEEDEIEARRCRIEKIKVMKQEDNINSALFDVFGIEERAAAPPDVAHKQSSDKNSVDTPEYTQPRPDGGAVTDADIYDEHLQNYLDDYFEGEFEGDKDLEYCDEDEFDIFEDPDETLLAHTNDEHPPLLAIHINEDDDCCSVVSEITVPLVR